MRIRISITTWLAALLVAASASDPRGAAAPSPVVFGDEFWKTWDDGRGELTGYDLVFPRYGKPRRGTAVAIFVTETFSGTDRVKADPGRHPKNDEFRVMKLNLVQDFPTGIYDYNLMTSVFIQLEEANRLPAGSPTKVVFSSQEWNGQVYEQILFDAKSARNTSHSYFDGEADREEEIAVPAGVIAEDALPLWARGFSAPALGPGETRMVPMVRSLATARLQHLPVAVIEDVSLSRGSATRKLIVPAGEFEVETFGARLPDGKVWTFWIESSGARRLIGWETSDGGRAEMLGSDRLAYWRMNGTGLESELPRLGLTARRPRTP